MKIEVRDHAERVTAEELAAPETPWFPRSAMADFLAGQVRYGTANRYGLQPLRALLDEARATYERVRGGKAICRYDDACCAHRTPGALDIEAQDLSERWHSLPAADRTTMEAQLTQWVHRMPDPVAALPAQAAQASGWACPFFLQAERRCGIAPYQPLQCRLYGLLSPAQAGCAAPLVGTETAERRHVFRPEILSREHVTQRITHAIVAFVGFLRSTADRAAGFRPFDGGYLPWLLYQRLAPQGQAAREYQTGAIAAILTSDAAAPPLARWASLAAREMGVTLHPEDAELAREGKPLKWKRAILGMPAIHLTPLTPLPHPGRLAGGA